MIKSSKYSKATAKTTAALLLSMVFSASSWAHGDVTPQSIDVSSIESLGEEWREENPYTADHKDHAKVVKIGESAYTQNCARCHGLGGVSGGIAPDLRELESGMDGDEWYVYRVQNGAVRNGAVYMPKMSEHLSQEALWSIRSWLLTLEK